MNPSFDLTIAEAKTAVRQLKRKPRSLQRPLVILGGWMDPCFSAPAIRRRMQKFFDDQRIAGISFGFGGTFDGCRQRTIEMVDQAFPTDDPFWTTEVDVIGFSMGGLVARYAAAPPNGTPIRRLRIARLFTISTPHRGARLAQLPTFNRLQVDMRTDSPFLASLNQSADELSYELVTYVRLGDMMVGAENAAPPGNTPWWVHTPPLQTPHLLAHQDPRIIADIARRLRGEAPFTTSPPAPLPTTNRRRTGPFSQR